MFGGDVRASVNQSRLWRALKAACNAVALLCAAVPGASCWFEAAVSEGESVFAFWTHIFGLLPGTPGVFLRRALYRLTLESCSAHCHIGFGTIVSHRHARIEAGVSIGSYVLLGVTTLKEGSLIGSRASLLSGDAHHSLGQDGRWTATDRRHLERIEIGPHSWIGESATVMASVGSGAVVAAGAVVSTAIPSGIVVAGNPARFVRRLRADTECTSGAGLGR